MEIFKKSLKILDHLKFDLGNLKVHNKWYPLIVEEPIVEEPLAEEIDCLVENDINDKDVDENDVNEKEYLDPNVTFIRLHTNISGKVLI